MKAAEDGRRYDAAHVLDGAMDRSVLVERPMSPQLIHTAVTAAVDSFVGARENPRLKAKSCSGSGKSKQRPRRGAALHAGLQFSRKLGCGAYTKCPDTHPKRGRLGSNSIRALRRRERAQRKRALVDSSGGRPLPPLQTMYQLPSHQQRQRLPHHSQPPRERLADWRLRHNQTAFVIFVDGADEEDGLDALYSLRRADWISALGG